MTFAERLNNENKRVYTRFIIENGKGYYLEDGQPMTRKEFEEKYPAPLNATTDPWFENIDGSRKWLY